MGAGDAQVPPHHARGGRCHQRGYRKHGLRACVPLRGNEVPADVIAKFCVYGYIDMEDRGFSEAEANGQVEKLSSASLLAPPAPTDCADDSSDEDIDRAQSGLETPGPLPASSSRLVIAGSSEIDIPMGSYVVPIQSTSRLKRLHNLGECLMKPGVDYVEFENMGLELPPATSYGAACRRSSATARFSRKRFPQAHPP